MIALSAGSQTDPVEASVTLSTGAAVAYAVAWQEYEIEGPDGGVDATVSATSYVVDGQHRPVTFLWNGGPGASSSPLHMNALGPRILQDGDVVENPDSIVDVSDLVFVDPVGTGFSRIRSEAAQSRLLRVSADAESVAALIRTWLSEHDRSNAPIHLVGESYGGFRLAALAPLVADLNVASVTLISPMLDAASVAGVRGNIMPTVAELPTLAATAFAHGKAPGSSAADVWDAADAFATAELLPALYQGSTLPKAEQSCIARRIGELTGLDPQLILEHNLMVDSETFLQTMRRSDDLLVGRLDTRVTGPIPAPRTDEKPASVDDPSLGIGPSFVIRSAPIADYLHAQVGVSGDDEYISLSLELNFAWDWRAEKKWPPEPYVTGVPSLRALIAARPATRVLLVGGFYDLATTLASTIRAVRHVVDDDTKLEILRLDAGHSIDAAVRAQAAAAIRRTISPGGDQ